MQIIVGLFFTFFSLVIISGSTKKSENLTTKLNQPLMENDEEVHD